MIAKYKPPITKACACRNVVRCRTREAGRLFLWFPVPETLKKVTSYLQQLDLEYELMHERPGLSLECRPGQTQEIAHNISQLMTPRELTETQVLFIRGAIAPQLQDFSDIASLQRFIKFSQSDWLVEMLATERFTSHFQPIVSIKKQADSLAVLTRWKDTTDAWACCFLKVLNILNQCWHLLTF